MPLATRSEANLALGPDPLGHSLVQPLEGASTDEQDVGGVNLDELLLRVLAPAMGWHIDLGTLNDLEQCLLHPLA